MKILFSILFLIFNNAWAGDTEEGDAALIKRDYALALQKYQNAAATNNAYAQYRIGTLYNSGLGVEKNYSEALRWYKLAAAQGNADAQESLGVMYLKGQGISQNYVKAHMWFNLASLKWTVGSNSRGYRDIVSSNMSTEQVLDAQKFAKECVARNFKNCD